MYTTQKNYGALEIVQYVNSRKVAIKFIGYENIVVTSAGNIRMGRVKNLMYPNVFDIGFTGEGDYSNSKNKKAYTVWNNMLKRCYSSEYQRKKPTYKGCRVVEEWLNFQNFAYWFYNHSNYKDGLELDKDILCRNNKLYSPETCVFVSRAVNLLLTDNKTKRGDYKVGVSFDSSRRKYSAKCSNGEGKGKNLGRFGTEEAAHEAYCRYKYALIKKYALTQEEPIKSALLSYKIQEY